MRVVIQRVTEGGVTICREDSREESRAADSRDESRPTTTRPTLTRPTETTRRIGAGFVILMGVCEEDTLEDVDWLVRKIIGLRVFDDENGVMNRSIMDVGGDILVVSQFTLYASYKKGNRPSWLRAARHEVSIPLYEAFCSRLGEALGKPVKTGEFGAMMQVSLVNDGPVTICMDTKNKE